MTHLNDLYHFVNGPWLKSHTIPDDRGVDGTFHALRDEAEEFVHSIVEEDTGRAGTLFASFMDTEGVNERGLEPIDGELDRISAADNVQDFAKVLGQFERDGVGAPVTFWVEKDSGSEEAVAYLIQSGLGLPDEAYYRADEHADTLAAYEEHVVEMLGFLDPARLNGLSGEDAAARIVALEKEIAAGHWDVVSTRDAVKTYNPTEFSELPAVVQTILRAAGLPEHRVVNMMPSFQDHLAQLLADDRLDDWKLWATWRVLRTRAGLLAEQVGRKNFEFYGTRLSGATEQRDRWKRGVGLTEAMVGQEIGKIFVDRHFPASSKEEMLELVDYLIAAYRERISTLSWMTEKTRERALEKLSQFKAKIGYPDTWRDYSGLEFSEKGADLVDNARKGAAFAHDYEVAKIGKPADRDEWVTTPQTVNAFYNPVVNDITFPAAILRPPFYNPEADAAENFGAIGSVIGHEIGHGFDDKGSTCDGEGRLRNWWTDEDRTAFEERTARLVGQYAALTPAQFGDDDAAPHVNGELTLGENIGDLGGLSIAYKAWKRAQEKRPTPDTESIDGYTPAQRLFISWGYVWQEKSRDEALRTRIATDPHSPAEFRAGQTPRNVDAFYEAFDVQDSDGMWLPEEERVAIW